MIFAEVSLRVLALKPKLPCEVLQRRSVDKKVTGAGDPLEPEGQTSSEPTKPGAPEETCPPCPPSLEAEQGFPTRFARLFFGVLTLLVLYYSYEIIKPYLVDIFLALAIFFTAKPLYRALSRVLFGKRSLASALTCLILALVIIIPLITLVSIVASQALEFSSQLSHGLKSGTLGQWLDTKVDLLKDYIVRLSLPLPPEEIKFENIVRTILNSASNFIYTNAIGVLSGFTNFFLDLSLILFVAFFLFLQGDAFIDEVKKLSPLSAADNEMILAEMEATIKATLWSTVVVAFIQGSLGGLGFFFFGVPQPAFWGTVMIPASIIPVVGAAIIWAPAVAYLFLKGAWAMGLGLLVFCGVVIGSVDNVVKPMLMRGSRSTPTVLVLLAILGGISYFGMIGFILGPFVLSLLLSLLSIYEKTILMPSRHPATVPVLAEPPESKRPISPEEDGPGTANQKETS
jgi:predicted PurR-regulated permease PerM